MALSIKNKKELANYVVNSLVEKFNYSKEAARSLISKSKIMEKLENDPEKVMNFNAEAVAEELVAKNK